MNLAIVGSRSLKDNFSAKKKAVSMICSAILYLGMERN